MDKLDMDIFNPNNMKKILVLGATSQEFPVFDDVVSIEKAIFLTSHNKKYQISCEGVMGYNDKHCTEILINEVDEFSVKNSQEYLLCESPKRKGKEIIIDKLTIKNLQTLSAHDDQLLSRILDQNPNIEIENNITIISSKLFAIVLLNKELENNKYFGTLYLNEREFFRVTDDKFKKELGIKEKKKNIGIEK